MQRLEVSGAVRPMYGSLGVKRLSFIQGNRKKNPYSRPKKGIKKRGRKRNGISQTELSAVS